MFEPKAAKPSRIQAPTPVHSGQLRNSLALPSGKPSARGADTKPGPAWDFRKIPIFAPGQPKPALFGAMFQPKLAIGRTDDPMESEADREADRVMSSPESPAKVTMAAQAVRVQDVAGAGRPLEPALRQDMERRFSHDFSRVRVHSGTAAEQSAREVHAKAYTAGNNIVFGAGRFAPGTFDGRRLIAHELVHVIQQSATGAGTPGPVLQRDTDEENQDPWDKLSPSVREEVEDLFDQCGNFMLVLNRAQQSHLSTLRTGWINELSDFRGRLSALDSDARVASVQQDITKFNNHRSHDEEKFNKEWESVERNYLDEHRHLLSKNVQSTDSIEAAKYLEELYRQTKQWFGPGVYITDEEYQDLKVALEKGRHTWVGMLRGGRIRGKQLQEMMDVVADLRRHGEDADKFIPNWNDQVTKEAAYLESAANSATDVNYRALFADLRIDLLHGLQGTLEAHKPDKSVLEIGVDIVTGGVDAITGPFIEAAKQCIDLVQIGIHFATGGKYDPKFKSDMAKAAEEGASTTDLLKGMVTGPLETPGRFLQACRDGDWEAISREAINLGMLAKTIKDLPEAVKKMPEWLAKTQDSLRVLRARTVALRMRSEGRFVPEPVTRPVAGLGRKLEPPSPPAPEPISRPVAGFKRELEPRPAAPPPPSRPVAGIGRKLGPPPPPEPTHLGTPSRPVPGFGRKPEPAALHPEPPGRPIAGVGRKLEPPPPAPAPPHQGPPVATRMPPAREIPSTPGAGDTIGQRGGKPATATAGKGAGAHDPNAAPATKGHTAGEKGKTAEPQDPLATEAAQKLAKEQALRKIREERASNNTRIKALDKEIADARREIEKLGVERINEKGDRNRAQLQEAIKEKERTLKGKEAERDKFSTRNRHLDADEEKLDPTPLPKPKSWPEAEDVLRKEFRGQKKSLQAGDLGERDIDCYTPDGISREAKFGGPHGHNGRIPLEIAKDVELLRLKKDVKSVEWHFYQDGVLRYGPNAELRLELERAGIKVVMHPSGLV